MSGWGDLAAGIERLGRRQQERRAQIFEQEQLSRSARVTAWGILGPGDPPPLPEAAEKVYDYRGLTPPDRLAPLEMTSLDGRLFPVGHAVEVRTPDNGFHPGPLFPIGVPFDVLRLHAVIIGPPGSGKTRYVMVPWIHSALFSSSVVALDAKGDMLDLVLEHAASWGSHGVRTGKWDYTDPAGSMSWDWVADIDDEHSLDAALTAILGRSDKQGKADPFFYNRDSQLLGGILQLASPLGLRTASDMVALLADQRKVLDAVHRFSGNRGAVQIQSVVGGLDVLDYSRAVSGVSSALQRLATPNIDRVTGLGRNQLRLDDLLSVRRLLIVVAPTQGGQTSEILSGLFLNLFSQRLYRRFRGSPGQVFLVVDEAPRFVVRFEFEKLLSLARSAGVSVILALQDVFQFKDENERSTLISNCATWLSLAGVEASTAQFLQGRLGKHNVAFWSQGTHSHRPGPDLRTQTESRPVLGEREIASPVGHRPAILHIKSRHTPASPILVDLEPQTWQWH